MWIDWAVWEDRSVKLLVHILNFSNAHKHDMINMIVSIKNMLMFFR